MAVATFTKAGNKAATPAKLDKAVFGVEIRNHELLKQAYVAYMANGRQNLALTKSRGDVRGGGRKPWRQKGTGKARFGSSRNPVWRGGGVAFGPRGIENYSHKLNISAKRQALRQALSLAANEDRIKVIEGYEPKDGKVKSTLALMKKIGAEGSILLVVAKKDEQIERASRNVPSLKVLSGRHLNIFDVMNADQIVISKDSLEIVQERLGGSK